MLSSNSCSCRRGTLHWWAMLCFMCANCGLYGSYLSRKYIQCESLAPDSFLSALHSVYLWSCQGFIWGECRVVKVMVRYMKSNQLFSVWLCVPIKPVCLHNGMTVTVCGYRYHTRGVFSAVAPVLFALWPCQRKWLFVITGYGPSLHRSCEQFDQIIFLSLAIWI